MAQLVYTSETKKLSQQIAAAITSGLTEYGLKHETAAKTLLFPGHGKVTGTLQRSIHAASPNYDYTADNVKASNSSPERSGTGGEAMKINKYMIRVSVGSGLNYAERIENLYNYLTKSQELTLPQLEPTIQKHIKAAGLA